MRYVLALLTALACVPASAGQYYDLAWSIATAQVPNTPVGDKCDNCDGTGRVGDGKIEAVCSICKGTGKKTTTSALPADNQATPWPAVGRMLNVAKPQPHEVVLDPGCGPEARLLVAAAQYYGIRKLVGIEIDPEMADRARAEVARLGLEDRITIITGDALDTPVDADVILTYMWPEFLEAYRPQLEKASRVVSYSHAVPGLDMIKKEDVYYWQQKLATMQQVMTTLPSVAVWHGRTYTGRRCSNPNCSMCNAIQRRLSTPVVAYSSGGRGHYETQCTFNARGQRTGCHKVWVPD